MMKVRLTLWLSRILVLLTLLAGTLGPIPAGAQDFQVTRLTFNDYADRAPQIDGDQVVWEASPGGPPSIEIYYYDLSWLSDPTKEPVSISNNDHNGGPQVDNGKVVWLCYDGEDWELYFYDLSWLSDPTKEPVNISNNSYLEAEFQINGNYVVWQAQMSDYNWEIFYYDLSWLSDPTKEPVNISNTSYSDRDPKIDGSQMVWYGQNGEYLTHSIFYFHLSWLSEPTKEPVNISNNEFDNNTPQIDGDQVVWYGYGAENGSSEIYHYDLSWLSPFSPGHSPVNLSNNDYSDERPLIDGSHVVWTGNPDYNNDTYEIYYYDLSWEDGAAPVTIAQTYGYPRHQIDEGKVVWQSLSEAGGTTHEIYYYDLSWLSDPTKEPVNISNSDNNDRDPQINGGRVVWEGSGEIYLASPEGENQTSSPPPGFRHFVGDSPYPPGVIKAQTKHDEKDKEVKSRVFPANIMK